MGDVTPFAPPPGRHRDAIFHNSKHNRTKWTNAPFLLFFLKRCDYSPSLGQESVSFWHVIQPVSPRVKMGDQLKKIADERDVGAFQSLFLTFWPKVRTMLMRQGADKETAEEIAQETLLAVWTKSYQYSSDRGTQSAWIFGIARNLRIDRVRKQAVWQQSYEDLETLERLHAPIEDPHVSGHRGDMEKALGKLPPEQLEVVLLSFMDGLSQSEIAKRLALPLGTVKSRMRLAFEKLRFATEGGA
jgi:RNA polymerase sigma-70 factor (ECF subfamily)